MLLASSEPKAEKEEMVLPEYTEKEELIRGYLERDEPLPADVIDGILSQLWSEEPFKSRGFVLDGFPNNESEATFLVEKGYLPDAVVMLRVDEEQIIKRLLPPRLAKWQARMAAKKEKKRLKALKKREKLMKRMKERRDEEIAKYEEEKRKKVTRVCITFLFWKMRLSESQTIWLFLIICCGFFFY